MHFVYCIGIAVGRDYRFHEIVQKFGKIGYLRGKHYNKAHGRKSEQYGKLLEGKFCDFD